MQINITQRFKSCCSQLRSMLIFAGLMIFASGGSFFFHDFLQVSYFLRQPPLVFFKQTQVHSSLQKIVNDFLPAYNFPSHSNIYSSFRKTKEVEFSYPYRKFQRFSQSMSLALRIDSFESGEFRQDWIHFYSLNPSFKSVLLPFQKWAPRAIQWSQLFGLSPRWVLAMIWTESRFSQDAVSPVMAKGLLQVMPGTQHFIRTQLIPFYKEKFLSKHSKTSMNPAFKKQLREFFKIITTHPHTQDLHKGEVGLAYGIFYLHYLLDQFNGNYRYATSAYNMGIGWVRQQLRSGFQVGEDSHYLHKITHYYQTLKNVEVYTLFQVFEDFSLQAKWAQMPFSHRIFNQEQSKTSSI